MIAICYQVFGEIDLAPILRRFRVVGIDDLPPAPRRQREAGGNQTLVQRADPDLESESQFAAEIAAEEVGCHECL